MRSHSAVLRGERLGARTQDVEVGDVDGDGDPDLVFGTVDGNRLLLNDGRGFFADAPGAFPCAPRSRRRARQTWATWTATATWTCTSWKRPTSTATGSSTCTFPAT